MERDARLSLPALLRTLSAGRIPPVALWVGDDLLTQMALDHLARRLGSEPGGIRRLSFDGREVRADRLQAECLTPSLFGGRPLVVVRHPSKIPDAEVAGLKSYVANPSPSACVVFVGEDVDQRRSFIQHLKGHASFVALAAPRGGEMGDLLDEEAERLGKPLAPGVARVLGEAVGAHPLLAVRELEKCIVHAGEAPRVTLEDVEAVVVEARDPTVWEMGDALLEGRTADALRALAQRRVEGDPPVLIVGALARMFRQFWWAAAGLERGEPAEAVLAEVYGPRLARWKATRIVPSLRATGAEGLRRWMGSLAALDRRTKSSRLNRWVLLEAFVLERAGARRPKGRPPGGRPSGEPERRAGR